MSSQAAVLKSFAYLTNRKGKKPNVLNLWHITRLLEEGKEIVVFESNRKRSVRQEHPAVSLFIKGILTKEELRAAEDYSMLYERSNISHHSRPSYDGTTTSAINYQSRDLITQSQFEASRKLAELRNRIALASLKKSGKKIIDLKYLKITEQVLEKQCAIRVVERNTGMNHSIVERKIKEVCEILMK